MRKTRIYVDTSVFGGCFDAEYNDDSNRFFEEARAGRHIILISRRTLDELNKAPVRVQQVLAKIPESYVELIDEPEEIEKLSLAYVNLGVLDKKHRADAEHIAAASVADADMVVSWNFKHMVHYDKIKGFQAVNIMNGYRAIDIYSPKEVISQP